MQTSQVIIIALIVLLMTCGRSESLLISVLQLIALFFLGWHGFTAGFVLIAIGAIANKLLWGKLACCALRVGENMIVCGPVATGILWAFYAVR